MKYIELQSYLIKKLKRRISLAEIANILNMDRSSISLYVKKNKDLKEIHKKQLEEYFDFEINENQNIDDYIRDDCVTLERIHIAPSCGKGTIVIGEAEITPITLGKKLIQNILKVSNIDTLKVFRASGDSMEPTIYDNDDLLVDISRKDYINGGIFLIEKFGDWFIKRLNRSFDGSLEIISDNKDKYQMQVIDFSGDVEINIIGRVIKNLSRGL